MLEDYLKRLLDWFLQLDFTALAGELVVLALAAIGAVAVHRTLGRFLLESTSLEGTRKFKRFTLRSAQRIVFPLSMLLGVLVGRAVLRSLQFDVVLLYLAVPLLLALAAIRLAVYVLRQGLHPGPAVKAWEHLISTSIWILFALHLLGL